MLHINGLEAEYLALRWSEAVVTAESLRTPTYHMVSSLEQMLQVYNLPNKLVSSPALRYDHGV